MVKYAFAPIPQELADKFRKIAKSEDPVKKWTAKIREILYAWMAMHEANVEPLKRLNAGLEEKAAKVGAQ